MDRRAELLAIIERDLTRWCLLEIGVDPAVLARLLPRGTDRGKDGVGLDAEEVAVGRERPAGRGAAPAAPRSPEAD